jgi:hypothetical protein
VPEFLQGALKPEALAAEVVAQVTQSGRREAQRQGLAEGLAGLGEPGVAQRVAEELQAMALQEQGRASR